MGHRVFIVGRGRRADIRLDDASVSRLHAELVVSDGGAIHVADRSSANGTWFETDGRWERIAQRAVVPGDRLRLGDVEIAVSELMRRVPARADAGTPADGQAASRVAGRRSGDGLPQGPVRRDPRTGEVIAD